MEEITSLPNPSPPTPEPEWRWNINLKIRKKFLLYLILPLVIIGLLLFGLITQGFISATKNITVAVKVVDEQAQAIVQAVVDVGAFTATTDASGNAILTGTIKGRSELATVNIHKTGYVSYGQLLTLKAGSNDLGTIALKETPVEKVDLTVGFTDYIAGVAVKDATVAIADISAIFNSATGLYQLPNVPLGDYSLTAKKTGYQNYTAKITVVKTTKSVDPIALVPAGSIVFESNRDGGLRGLFTANYDGSSQKNLITRQGKFEDYSPVLSPNQQKVLFHSTRDGTKQDSGIGYKEFLYVVDATGQNIAKIPNSSDIYDPKWSSDSRLVGYTFYDATAQKSRLHIYNVAKKTDLNFTDYNNAGSFSFSHDAKLIAFVARPNDQDFNYSALYYASTEGGTVNLIESRPNDSNGYQDVEFTADGKIRFGYYDNAAKKNRYFEYTVSTSSKVEISSPDIDRFGAVLSPNKKLRAYISNRDGKSNLFISAPDGKNEKKLTALNHLIGDILWSTDSGFVMFNNKSADESARYLVSTNGTAGAKKITDINLTSYGYDHGE